MSFVVGDVVKVNKKSSKLHGQFGVISVLGDSNSRRPKWLRRKEKMLYKDIGVSFNIHGCSPVYYCKEDLIFPTKAEYRELLRREYSHWGGVIT